MDLLRALRHIHGRNFLHTDVKPQNILVPNDRHLAPLKLIDVGGAVEKDAKGRFVGTAEAGCQLYMPRSSSRRAPFTRAQERERERGKGAGGRRAPGRGARRRQPCVSAPVSRTSVPMTWLSTRRMPGSMAPT